MKQGWGTSLAALAVAGLLACADEPWRSLPAIAMPLEGLDPALALRLEEARNAVLTDPEEAEAWGEFALSLHGNFLHAEARGCYERTLALAGDEARWLYHLAVLHQDTGDAQSALACLERALELAPERAGIHWRLGHLRLEAGSLDEAERAFAETIRLAPASPGGWSGRAQVHMVGGDPQAALADLSEGVRVAPASPFVRHLRARVLNQLGRYDEAEREGQLGGGGVPEWYGPWDKELRLRAVATLGLRRLVANEFYDNGQFEEAVELLERLASEVGDDVHHLCFLGRAYMRVGRISDALAVFERCLALAPEDRTSMIGLAEAQLRADLLDEAEATLERTVEAHPRLGAAHHFRGVLLGRRGEHAAAVEAFRACLALDQRNADTRAALGRQLLELRRWREAEEAFEAARGVSTQPGDLHVGLARALQMQGDLEGARAELAAARSLPVQDRALQRRVQRALDEAGRAGGTP